MSNPLAIQPEERRRHPRAPAVVQVRYATAGVLRTDYAENISRGGLFIATDAEFTQGQRVEVRLVLAGAPGAVPVEGVVRWIGERSPEPGAAPVRGVGLEFDLRDPVKRARLEAMIDAIVEPGPPPAEGQAVSILLVDPNRHARTLFREGLESMARETFEVDDWLRVVEAADGLEALRQLLRAQFALVMVELRTPEVDGVELIRRIRTQVSSTVPIFATARPFPGAKADALAAGADVFLPKPLRLKPLFNTLRSMLRLGDPQGL